MSLLNNAIEALIEPKWVQAHHLGKISCDVVRFSCFPDSIRLIASSTSVALTSRITSNARQYLQNITEKLIQKFEVQSGICGDFFLLPLLFTSSLETSLTLSSLARCKCSMDSPFFLKYLDYILLRVRTGLSSLTPFS